MVFIDKYKVNNNLYFKSTVLRCQTEISQAMKFYFTSNYVNFWCVDIFSRNMLKHLFVYSSLCVETGYHEQSWSQGIQKCVVCVPVFEFLWFFFPVFCESVLFSNQSHNARQQYIFYKCIIFPRGVTRISTLHSN